MKPEEESERRARIEALVYSHLKAAREELPWDVKDDLHQE